MAWHTLGGHVLTVLAVLAGIAGMGMVFDAAMHGSVLQLTQGIPLLLMGLWWAGRELGRSMMASRGRASRPPPTLGAYFRHLGRQYRARVRYRRLGRGGTLQGDHLCDSAYRDCRTFRVG